MRGETNPLNKRHLAFVRRIAIPFFLMTLAGCAAIRGYPTEPPSLPLTVASLDEATIAALFAEYNKAGTDDARKQTIRNEIIFSDIAQIDQSFNSFKVRLNEQGNTLSIGTDFVTLALAGLGATLPGAATKTALAAASAGVIGAQTAIDKDVLYEKTITALVTEMEAQRGTVYARILTNMKLDATTYPLVAASKDLQDYYQAGTLVSALQGVSQSAGAKAQNAADQVQMALSANYNYSDLSKQIGEYWKPDGANINSANQAKLLMCMKSNNFVGSIPFLIYGSTDDVRMLVIKCFNM